MREATGWRDRMDNEKMTMEQRIEAFYRQSGGPNNDRIPELLEKHLLHAKDHGMPGYRETFEDGIMDVVLNDPSLLLLYERIQRWRLKRRAEGGDMAALKERIESLEREVARLRETIDRMMREQASAGDSESP
jgi:hypothetical protein